MWNERGHSLNERPRGGQSSAHPHVDAVGGIAGGDEGGSVETPAPIVEPEGVCGGARGPEQTSAAAIHTRGQGGIHKQLQRVPDDTVGEDTDEEAYRINRSNRNTRSPKGRQTWSRRAIVWV